MIVHENVQKRLTKKEKGTNGLKRDCSSIYIFDEVPNYILYNMNRKIQF